MVEYKIYLSDELIKSVCEHKDAMIKHWSHDESLSQSLKDSPIEFFISDYIIKNTRLHANKEV